MVFILSALWWIRSLWKLLNGRDWLWGKLGLVLMGRAMLSKSLIQFSVDGWGCVPSLLFDLRPNYGGGNEDKVTSFTRPPSLVAQTVKHLPTMRERPGLDPRVRKITWRRKCQPTPVPLPRKFHGWRSLVGYSPWSHKESDTTERLHSLTEQIIQVSR